MNYRYRIPMGLVLLAFLAASCASPGKLAQKSEEALGAGQEQKAYDLAKRALDKDPSNARAQAAMASAAQALANDWKGRIRSAADIDSVTAADLTLQYDAFRLETVRYRVSLTPDPVFAEEETAVRNAAAVRMYRQGEADLADGHPKDAYWSFQECRKYVPDYRDVDLRADAAFEQALTVVAILPFTNETDVTGLTQELNDYIQAEVDRRIVSGPFEFTRLVSPEEIHDHMTLSQLQHLSPEEARELGRTLGADRVVRGRIYGASSDTRTDSYGETIYRKVTEKDEDGTEIVTYVDESFSAILRERKVKVSYEMEILDTEGYDTISRRRDTEEVVARTAYSEFTPTGACDNYCLLPPAAKKNSPDRWKRSNERWSNTFGTWTLPKFLEQTKNHSKRTRYTQNYRKEFYTPTVSRPVFLDDLPGEDELVMIALQNVWEPVYAMLRESDAK